jgi:hypothetical protein
MRTCAQSFLYKEYLPAIRSAGVDGLTLSSFAAEDLQKLGVNGKDARYIALKISSLKRRGGGSISELPQASGTQQQSGQFRPAGAVPLFGAHACLRFCAHSGSRMAVGARPPARPHARLPD